ncbi:MAG: thioredoxin [Patescibacteria group bacterium]|nr:thioredoxin [Patescibacteria group bacterium]
MAEVTLTDQNFEQEVVKEESLPVLVDFWASWCGPCRALAPVIEELAKEFEGKVKVCKIEVDQNPVTAGKFNVMSIPTLVIFQKGQLVKQLVGSQPKQKIADELNQILK